jgi:hypothetical protein
MNDCKPKNYKHSFQVQSIIERIKQIEIPHALQRILNHTIQVVLYYV